MNTAVLVILASTVIHQPDPCPDYTAEVQRAALEVYLDPSDARRAAVTRRLITTALTPLRSVDDMHRPERGRCAVTVAYAVSLIADEELFVPAIQKQARIYDRLYETESRKWAATGRAGTPRVLVELKEARRVGHAQYAFRDRRFKQRPVAAREELLKKAREVCFNDKRGRSPCTRDFVNAIVLSGDANECERLRHHYMIRSLCARDEVVEWALDTWVLFNARFPDRHQRLGAVLDVRTRTFRGRDALLREWALEELVGAPDPREWSPADVALVVRRLREADEALAVPVPQPKRVIVFHPNQRGICTPVPGLEPEPCGLLKKYLAKLKPMGMLRGLELAQVRSVTIPVPGAPMNRAWEHFPGELSLYEREWKTRNPRGAGGMLDRAAHRNMRTYVQKRWSETDSDAPTPNLRRVRELLKKQESGRRKPASPQASPPSHAKLPPVRPARSRLDPNACCKDPCCDKRAYRRAGGVCPEDPAVRGIRPRSIGQPGLSGGLSE